ncbi:MAG TPA: SIMPL domain-containing protein [Candidatus Binatia bacterium]|jgi:hypothetical protein
MKIFITSVILCLLAVRANAQSSDKPPPPPAVTATAEAVITVEPDQAEIDIGVVTQARTAPDAARENAEKLSRVTGQLKKLIGSGDELKTASYSLTPNYRYPQGGKPEIAGYTASNTVRIKTGNLENVGKLIDAGMQSGANNINRLVFTLRDEQNAQLQALRIASQKAKAKTDEMAAAVGLKTIRVLSIVEGERGFRPIPVPQLRAAQMEAAPAAPTPVEAGTIEVRSTVTLTAEIGSR